MLFKFFESDSYFIDEKVNFMKFANEYKIYDNQAIQIGMVKQRLSGGQKALRLLLNKAMLPFHLEIQNHEGAVQSSIKRGWTFFMSKISVFDGNDTLVGTIQQKFKLFKPTFKIFDPHGIQIAEITGDWKAWNFSIKDAQGSQIGTVNKKWAGLAKEFFTTADKYNVTIDQAYPEDNNKILILSSAITIDMVLKEAK
ncbi:scramblase [Taibaiella sp. KBW10]|uniref:LURP-one-related/scramblase family protein n=1 Tax=Taibaiella sp. KBW10 TaxID=2153357 RepID=UPI000F596351|nr:phospholipid scramblase-related protein [Taibaiella sp. KBW10]RQO30568.1 scramblase [Taibaiella sp. KBW10]